LAAVRADAVELHPVPAHDETEKARDPLLLALELLAVELDDLAAALADDVVVVLRRLLTGLIACLAVLEVALGGEPALLEQLERPIDGRIPHPRIRLPN